MKTLSDIKTIAVHARATLVQDAMGVVALTVMLVVTLHVPSFF